MRTYQRFLTSGTTLIIVLSAMLITPATTFAGSQPSVRVIHRATSASLPAGRAPAISNAPLSLELPKTLGGLQQPNSTRQVKPAGGVVNRTHADSAGRGGGQNADNGRSSGSPQLALSFDGLNHYNQRTANGGNQFSLEPPDQGLCVGNGYVIETVNDVLRVYNTAGAPLSGVISQNEFYGYAPAIVRSNPPAFGPFVTDPSCYFDQPTQRWFHVVLTLDIDPKTGNFLGPNHLDLAVSKTANPLGGWNFYIIPAQNDGTQGTPNHGCTLDGTKPGPCLGDYPHIGADANGFYITTNEYDFFGPAYQSANVYALPKAALAAGASSVNLVLFDTKGVDNGKPGFTIWPATGLANGNQGNGNRPAHANGGQGTEYFLSSNAAEEVTGTTAYTSNQILVWALTNTASLNSTPAVSLTHTTLRVRQYSLPPAGVQKAGPVPLATCLNNDCAGFGTPPTTQVEGKLDTNDTRMQQVVFADGKLWGALDTAVRVDGRTQAGIAWYIIEPETRGSRVSASLARQGQLGMAGADISYPAVAVTNDGKGAIAFSLSGRNNYPSAAYVGINGGGISGDIRIAAAGKGPQDGFTEYFLGGGRPRWGDYGAAVAVDNRIWMASEYIAQSCTYTQFLADTTCGGTRTILANWATRVSVVQP